jgi:hypothetical protein
MNGERWLPIPDCPGYEVSDLGRVRSHYPQRGVPGPHILTGGIDRYGYHVVHFRPIGREQQKVHALVLRTFVGPRPEGKVVRHLDGNPSNNTLGNLAYGTQSENILDSVAHGTHWARQTSACKKGHEWTDETTRITPNGTRRCRICLRANSRRYRQQRRAAA